MKTSNQSIFAKLKNEFLEDVLEQMVKHYDVIQIFYTKDLCDSKTHLVIHLYQNNDAENLRSKSWVDKVRLHFQINVYLIYSARLEYQCKLGHPFFEYYCQPSAIIYQKENSSASLIINQGWQKYKKRFNKFEDRFFHDHDIKHIQIQKLISEGSSNSVFTFYEELINYDLDYLEDLYSGNFGQSSDLDQRIKLLIIYIPEIQKYFVKKNEREYLITELFAKTRKAIEEKDEVYNEELFEAVGLVETSLFYLVEDRFIELRKMIKKQYEEKTSITFDLLPTQTKQEDEVLQSAIERITASVELEQIYCFHQIIYGETTTYYLLIIGLNIGCDKLGSMTQSLKSIFGDRCDFVLISHDRYYLQKNIYQFQNFFANILQSKYLIYSIHDHHPELHWEKPHSPSHNDLYFHYEATYKTALQFFKMTDGKMENHQGIANIFSLFFLSFCRTFIFVKTFYLPHYLSSKALWELCIYTDTNLRKYSYLTEQFSTDIFSFLDYHRTVHHKLIKVNDQNLTIMKSLAEKLMNELSNMILVGGLLTDFEKESVGVKSRES